MIKALLILSLGFMSFVTLGQKKSCAFLKKMILKEFEEVSIKSKPYSKIVLSKERELCLREGTKVHVYYYLLEASYFLFVDNDREKAYSSFSLSLESRRKMSNNGLRQLYAGGNYSLLVNEFERRFILEREEEASLEVKKYIESTPYSFSEFKEVFIKELNQISLLDTISNVKQKIKDTVLLEKTDKTIHHYRIDTIYSRDTIVEFYDKNNIDTGIDLAHHIDSLKEVNLNTNNARFTNKEIFILIVSFILILLIIVFLKKEKDVYWKKEMPNLEALKIPLQQYFIFFKKYVKDVKGEGINLNINEVKDGLELTVKLKDNLTIEKMDKWFNDYFNFLTESPDESNINVEKEDLTKEEIILIIADLKNQLNSLKRDIEIKRAKDILSKDDSHFLKKMVQKENNTYYNTYITTNNIQSQKNYNHMKIENQNIYGGNQQFADLIINESSHLGESDRELIQFINEHAEDDVTKNGLIQNLEVLKSTEVTEEKKKESGGVLKKFFDSIASESGSQFVQSLLENGPDYIQNIF